MELLQKTMKAIAPLDEKAMAAAQARLDDLVKPIGSLGRLEALAAQISGITGQVKNELKKKAIIVMSSDNGIVEEGVAAAPQVVTLIMTNNFVKGVTGMAVLAKEAGADITVVDIGVNGDTSSFPGVLQKKIAFGTANFAKGPAMSKEDAVKAMEIGIEVAENRIAEGYDLIGTGEMGIGNTSSSSCILTALGGVSLDVSVGKGAGLTVEAHELKKKVLQQALDLNKPDKNDPIDVVAKVGGFDIAGLAGVFLACAAHKVPVVVDGFISAAAAFVAYRLNPLSRQYMIPSHSSAEPGFLAMMAQIEMEPILNLDMRLGEGSGCPIAFHVLDCALAIMNHMATFAEATVSNETLVDIRE